jgi:hypothetical protein
LVVPCSAILRLNVLAGRLVLRLTKSGLLTNAPLVILALLLHHLQRLALRLLDRLSKAFSIRLDCNSLKWLALSLHNRLQRRVALVQFKVLKLLTVQGSLLCRLNRRLRCNCLALAIR